jgi:nucleoside-diphosphate-sugar epimerase
MKVLFIGGTGNISTSVSKRALQKGIDLYLLTRGKSGTIFKGATHIAADINSDNISEILKEYHWDCVVNWIAFHEQEVKRDIELFSGRTAQYIFISSASVYQKPLLDPIITESTPIANPFWEYSQNKIACEELLNRAYREQGFPMTIVRPSHTYDTVIPLSLGAFREYTVIDRMKKGKKIIVHGDGTSLWTVTHAEDFASGFTGLLGNGKAVGHAFHITSDEVFTWNHLYEMVGEVVGTKPHLVHIPSDFIEKFMPGVKGSLSGDKAVSAIFDNSKIKKYVPEFKATIPFNEGIRRTIDWFESHPEKQIINQETDTLMDRVIRLYETAFNGTLK